LLLLEVTVFSRADTSSGFSRKIRGANGLNLPNILDEAPVLNEYLGIFADYTCFL